jgi:hypothetical protein
MQGPEDDPRVLCGYQNTGVPLRLFPISLDAQVDVFMVQERKVLQLELLISRLTILVLQSSMRNCQNSIPWRSSHDASR